MSPKLFREEAYGSEVYVWAYGLLVHYLLFKEHYFMENTEQKVKKRVLETRYTLSLSSAAKFHRLLPTSSHAASNLIKTNISNQTNLPTIQLSQL
jgi:hypothetical protein